MITRKKLIPCILYMLGFSSGLYCNMRALSVSNVETVIVARAMVPVSVSILDYFFLGRQLPNKMSTLSLMLILLGTVGYVRTDKDFQLNGLHTYLWPLLYFSTIAFQMTYGKFMTDRLNLSLSTLVAYVNSLSIIPLVSTALITQEYLFLFPVH